LTEFAGNSTAAVKNQDGYGPGRLSTVSVNNAGEVVGVFSNGIKKSIATVQIATFRDESALERLGNGYYVPSAGSGIPVAGRAMTNGAGALRSGALEKSDSDVAADFANMIQARSDYRPNEILRELTGFIR
jgi:flagellar hook protein FlgE